MERYTFEQAQKLVYPIIIASDKFASPLIAKSFNHKGFELIDDSLIYFAHAYALPDSIIPQLNSVQPPPKKNTLVIFGAPDFESIHARKVLNDTNCFTGTATYAEKPVHAGNALQADGYILDNPQDSSRIIDSVIIFECNPNISPIVPFVCDHHMEGDYGYGMGAAQYWAASSIGQMCKYLSITPDQEMLMIAAGDHCPAEAYAGQCPNVDPTEFAQLRISLLADYLKISEQKILCDMSRAIKILHETFNNQKGYADLTAVGPVDQLREASLKTGKAYIANAPLPEGCTEKIVMGGHTTPQQIERFKCDFEKKGYQVYGNPTRGFAGATK